MQRGDFAGISSEFGGMSLTGISRELAGIGCVTLFDRVSSGWEKSCAVCPYVVTQPIHPLDFANNGHVHASENPPAKGGNDKSA